MAQNVIRNRPTFHEEGASGLWRSEDMCLVRMHMQREAAHHTVLKLGHLGMVMFQDLNKETSAFQRDFSGDVRRCDDMERRLRFLDDELKKSGITYIADLEDGEGTEMREGLNGLERSIEKADTDVRELSTQFESLVNELNRTREHKEVLARDLLGGMDALPTMSGGGLNMVCGVMPSANIDTFQRLVYRTTRGNSVVRVEEIEEPFESPNLTDEIVKSVFVVFFSASRLKEKMRKLAELSGGTIYNYVESRDELTKLREHLRQRYDTIGSAIIQNATVRNQTLSQCAEHLATWKRAVATEKGVFGVLNLLQFSGPTVVAQGWVPVSKLDSLAVTLKQAERECGAQVATIVEVIETKETKPTYFNTNKITGTFQGIVDSYGIPKYKELNPGVFTIITFPYLFGIMYGDMGHGVLLTLFALCLVAFERRLLRQRLNEIVAMIFGGRYLLLGMGIFATYIGVLYNDCFGFSVELFESAYKWPQLPSTTIDKHGKAHHTHGKMGTVHPSHPNGHPSVKPMFTYPMGIDVAWAETDNKLEFYNSTKMKCAVIIGVIQMLGGIILSLLNHLRRKDWRHVWFGFVPEFVFLSCTFGYMGLLIIIKWITPWHNTNLAPSLLETMTNFFLAPGVVNLPVFKGQAELQVLLLLVAFSMVPFLLLAIPYLEYQDHKRRVAEAESGDAAHRDAHHEQELSVLPAPREADETDALSAESADDGGHGGHFDFSEIMIHYIIHTIEFVLGCVSNTASYLRLWALSLAHAQLSDVFWNFAFMMTVGLDSGSGAYVFVGFAVWLSATLGVLLGMESLSAFLHALRLHWVEFNGKFYAGDGVKFAPFAISDILAEVK